MALDPYQGLQPGQSCAVVQTGGPADTSAVHVQRDARAVNGGAKGFVNSATVSESIVGANDSSDEWAHLTKLRTSGSGENVGDYTQVLAEGVGQTVWGDCVEVHDVGGNNNALVGRETDLTGGDANSIGHDLVIDNPHAIGERIGPPEGKPNQSIASAFHIAANCTKGVLRIKSGQAAVINEELNAGFFVADGYVSMWANGRHMIFDGKKPPYFDPPF